MNITYDSNGRIIEYNNQRITYINRKKDKPIDIITKATNEGRMLTVNEIVSNIQYVGLGYEDLDILNKRIDRLLKLEENAYEKKDVISTMKIDYTDYTGIVSQPDLVSLMRLFNKRLYWKDDLNTNILEYGYSTEVNSVDKWGLHFSL